MEHLDFRQMLKLNQIFVHVDVSQHHVWTFTRFNIQHHEFSASDILQLPPPPLASFPLGYRTLASLGRYLPPMLIFISWRVLRLISSGLGSRVDQIICTILQLAFCLSLTIFRHVFSCSYISFSRVSRFPPVSQFPRFLLHVNLTCFREIGHGFPSVLVPWFILVFLVSWGEKPLETKMFIY